MKIPVSIPSSAGDRGRAPHPSGSGAACSRSNVAEQSSCFYGRQQYRWRKRGKLKMSKYSHRQRRRRMLNAVLIFKVFTALGQAVVAVLRLWSWFSDRQ